MEPTQKRSCFVIAPVGVQIGPLLETLRKTRIEPFFISDFLSVGETAVAQMRTAFRSVDFVIALLYSSHSINSTLFELGFALGLSKPAMVFADDDVRLPLALRDVEVHHVSVGELASIASFVENFADRLDSRLVLRTPKVLASEAHYERQSPSRRGRREQTIAHAEFLHQPYSELSPSELEEGVSRFLKNAGYLVAIAPRDSQRAVDQRVPDLAIWVDDVQKEIGNPIAIELKSSPRFREEQIGPAVQQLIASLDSVGATTGILLHTNPNIQVVRNLFQKIPYIFVFYLADFVSLIENGTLSSALKEARNAAVHGLL